MSNVSHSRCQEMKKSKNGCGGGVLNFELGDDVSNQHPSPILLVMVFLEECC